MYKDLQKLPFPVNVLETLEHKYDIDEKFELDGAQTEGDHDDNDSAGIRSLKKWIESKNVTKKPTWENLVWLLKEYGELDIAHQLAKYITTAPEQELDTMNGGDVTNKSGEKHEGDNKQVTNPNRPCDHMLL